MSVRLYINTSLSPTLREKCPYIWSFSGSYFPAFRLNTEIYSVNPRIQSECWKIPTRKSPNMDTSYTVQQSDLFVINPFQANVPFQYNLKTSGVIEMFSGVMIEHWPDMG